MKSSETVDKIEKSTLVTCRKFQYNSKRGMHFFTELVIKFGYKWFQLGMNRSTQYKTVI